MGRLQESRHTGSIREMFARISRRYDLLNRLMTFGQDLRWRRQAVKHLSPVASSRVLDVGAGTGDLALEVKRRAPQAMVVAVDFTPEMISRGLRRRGAGEVHWLVADAMRLPFSRQSFDGVISGFLLRNLTDVDHALEEQGRVLRTGGTMVALDAVAAEEGRRTPLTSAYMRVVIPFLGRLVAGDAAAYNYLPTSMDAFLSARGLGERMLRAGLSSIAVRTRMFGTIAILRGSKAGDWCENISGGA